MTLSFETIYETEKHTIQIVVGRMLSGKVITMMATSRTDQLLAAELMISKIYSNLKEI